MAVTAVEQTALTVSTTELSLLSGTSTLQSNATACVIQIVVDGANMVKGDEFVVRIYETARSGGTKRVAFTATLDNAQSELFVAPSLAVLNGWDVTMQRTAGADRAFDTSVRKIG